MQSMWKSHERAALDLHAIVRVFPTSSERRRCRVTRRCYRHTLLRFPRQSRARAQRSSCAIDCLVSMTSQQLFLADYSRGFLRIAFIFIVRVPRADSATGTVSLMCNRCYSRGFLRIAFIFIVRVPRADSATACAFAHPPHPRKADDVMMFSDAF
jgi:hypothetical protein